MANQVLKIIFDDDTCIPSIEIFVETIEKIIEELGFTVNIQRFEEDFEMGVIYADD